MRSTKVKKAKKTAIYDFTTGQIAATGDLTETEFKQALKDIAATFYDRRLPANAVTIVWEKGKVTSVQCSPALQVTRKLFYKEDGTLYPANV